MEKVKESLNGFHFKCIKPYVNDIMPIFIGQNIVYRSENDELVFDQHIQVEIQNGLNKGKHITISTFNLAHHFEFVSKSILYN